MPFCGEKFSQLGLAQKRQVRVARDPAEESIHPFGNTFERYVLAPQQIASYL
jgi:hypothetical protein